MKCINCDNHSGDGLLCSACSETYTPAFNLLGNSIFTDIRSHGSACMDLGPAVEDGVKVRALNTMGEEIDFIHEKLDSSRDPGILARRFEQLLINSGLPEIMEHGDVPLTRECSAVSADVLELGQELRDAGAAISPRTENLLGNLFWLRTPVFSGKMAVDARQRDDIVGKHSHAIIRHYDRAIISDPDCLAAMKNRAMLLHVVGRNTEVVKACNIITQKVPDDMFSWDLMGRAYSDLGDFSEAIRCFDRALGISPKEPMTWMNKAKALARMERFSEALACFDRSLQLDPGNSEALIGKGDALTKIGKIDLAVESYDRAKKHMPRPAFIPRKQAPTARKTYVEPVTAPQKIMMEVPPQEEEKLEPISEEVVKIEPEMREVKQVQISREIHPPEKLAKVPFEMKMEGELEDALGTPLDDDVPQIEKEAKIAEPPAPKIEKVPEEVAFEKKPKSLAEMFVGGLTIPDDAEEEEDEIVDDEWPTLPDEVEFSRDDEDDEPVLGPLLGIPTKPEVVIEKTLPDAEETLAEIEEFESEQMPTASPESHLNPVETIKMLLDDGDYFEALKRTDELLGKEPNNAELMAVKGHILMNMDRIDDSRKMLDRAVEKDPKNIQAWIYRGYFFYELDEYDKAMENLDNALKFDEDNTEAWLMKGECQLSLEDFEQAIVSFNEVIELELNNLDAWIGIGDAFLGLDREDDAYKCYEKVTALDPSYPEGWSRLGDVLIQMGRWGGAMQMYDRAIKADPEHPEAYLKKAGIMMKRGMMDEADAMFSKLLDRFPTDLDALTGRAEIQIRKGKWGAAIQALKSVLMLHPDSARAWALQGDAYREQGNVAQAKEPYDKAIELDPEDFTALVGKGRLMLEIEEYNDAIDCFRKAIDFDSEDPYVWRFLGIAQKVTGKEKEALKSFEMATEYGDNIPENWMEYGMALHESARYPEAIEAFDRITKIVPGHKEAVKWREQSAKRLLKEVS